MSLTLALLLAGQAATQQPPLAQGVPETPSTRDAAGEQDGADILVTARRRQERAQSVPIALSVLDSATIARTGTFSIQQISQQAPTLQYTSSNRATPR
jgi:iron complex outermembrane receptor protein